MNHPIGDAHPDFFMWRIEVGPHVNSTGVGIMPGEPPLRPDASQSECDSVIHPIGGAES